jgi:2-isopropylmalate synthase
MIRESVAFLKVRGREVIYDAEHFFDGYKRNPDYALETLRAAAEGGADVLVLCDTNGGSLPWEVQEIVRRVVQLGLAPVGIHTHNDGGVAEANALVAVREGAVQVQGTINGYGERCGNCDLVAVIPNLVLKLGVPAMPPELLRRLTELSWFVSEVANVSHDDRQPFVGRSAFAHKGGIHVSAVARHPETYEHIDPETVGNRRRVVVSELAGRSNLLYKAQVFGIDLPESDAATTRLLQQVKALEFQGYQFEGADASLELLMRRTLGLASPRFELEAFRVTVEKRPDEAPTSEATIKVRVDGRREHTAAEGNGPVNALDNALRKALEEFYPEVRNIRLVDYKVRVLEGEDGTASKVRVLIESADDQGSWSTVGVSTNIIEASWEALVDSLEYGLQRQLGAAPGPKLEAGAV